MSNYFENIKGQNLVCKILQSQLDNNNVSHAYLFCGAAGSQKTLFAKALAKSIIGDAFSKSIDNNTCADFKMIYPMGVNSYLVSQIKEIVKDANLSPMLSKHKVYVLQDCDKLGSSAANAFLKTLEEPLNYVCFILLTNNKDNVLPTILSRCQTLSFNPLPYDVAVDSVVKQSGAAKDDAKNSLDLFGGNTTKAIEFCQDQNLMDFNYDVNNLLPNLDQMTDWEVLQESNLIVSKIKEIIDIYKQSLDEKTNELAKVLEHSAITLIEEQNKRQLSFRQKEVMMLLCSTIKLYFRKKVLNTTKNEQYIKTLDVLSKIEQDLSYNIAVQNFCDVVLLVTKYKGQIDYDKYCSC